MSKATAFLLSGLVTGLSDFTFAVVLTVFVFGSTFERLWQGVASATRYGTHMICFPYCM